MSSCSGSNIMESKMGTDLAIKGEKGREFVEAIAEHMKLFGNVCSFDFCTSSTLELEGSRSL